MCPDTPTSPLPVAMQHVKTSLPPDLKGGALLDGSYGLTNIEVFSSSMLAGGALPVNFEFTDNQSRGMVRIEGDSWSFLADRPEEDSFSFALQVFCAFQFFFFHCIFVSHGGGLGRLRAHAGVLHCSLFFFALHFF